MSMRSLESAICWELREVSGARSLRVKDMMEWRNAPLSAQDGEIVFKLPIHGVWVAVKREALGKRWVQPAQTEEPTK